MSKDLSKLIWPATVLACAVIVGAGAYFGLKDNHPSAPRDYSVSAPAQAAGPAAPDETATTVYVTRTGACYHRETCSYLRRSRIPMELSKAKQLYRPYSQCRPPQ
jgi:hypothetical protein